MSVISLFFFFSNYIHSAIAYSLVPISVLLDMPFVTLHVVDATAIVVIDADGIFLGRSVF